MNKLQCELCGSVDIVKIEDNVFQCQYCGCKYTAEEAKKIILGEVTFKTADFTIVGGKLTKYNGEEPSVDIPDNVSVIGEHSFEGCSGITSVNIPQSVKIIEESAFKGCGFLTQITIPGNVIKIGADAFSDCSNITTVNLGKGIQTIEAEAFSNCTSLKEIYLPDSVTELGEGVFYNNKSLKQVRLSPNIKVLGLKDPYKGVFGFCTSLETIELPEGLEYIGKYTFEGCTALKQIKIPYSIKDIDPSAFNGFRGHDACTCLTTIIGNRYLFFKKVRSSIPAVCEYRNALSRERIEIERIDLPHCLSSFWSAYHRAVSNGQHFLSELLESSNSEDGRYTWAGIKPSAIAMAEAVIEDIHYYGISDVSYKLKKVKHKHGYFYVEITARW